MFVKFCGFTREEDLEEAVRCGVDAVGFVFYNKSSRYVPVEKAYKLLQRIAGTMTKTVGVFVDETPSRILQIASELRLDYAQIYSREIMLQINRVLPVLMGHRIKDEKDISQICIPEKGYVLLDSYSSNAYGGTGNLMDWNLLRSIPLSNAIVAGGLTAHNVGLLVRNFRPFGVDVSSGIEEYPGKKSAEKMRAFLQKLKEALGDE
ncbi:MAG: phosphoribosylanthranilate isomerase [Spirochaetes bacterium]|nr:phosphoribosylanthranilate isomerase [Spirochaetota bacterium]